jgi:hypothetical protein
MSNDNSLSLAELNDRIAVIRDNIRQLVEQAAASSGARDEERTSGRIAQQQEALDKLVKERDAMTKKIAAREKQVFRLSISPRRLLEQRERRLRFGSPQSAHYVHHL